MKLTLQTSDVLRLYGNFFWKMPNNPLLEIPPEVHTQKKLDSQEVKEAEPKLNTPPQTEIPPIVIETEKITHTVENIPQHVEVETPKIETKEVQKVEETPQTLSIYEGGVPISWKLGKKKNAKIVFIIDETTFSNAMILNGLRSVVIDEVKVPAEYVVFGTYPTNAAHWHLTDMPVQTGLLFSEPQPGQPNPFLFEDKKVFVMGDLKNVVMDTKRQEKLKNWLKKYFLQN